MTFPRLIGTVIGTLLASSAMAVENLDFDGRGQLDPKVIDIRGAAAAVINYQAEANKRAFEAKQEAMFMPAPNTEASLIDSTDLAKHKAGNYQLDASNKLAKFSLGRNVQIGELVPDNNEHPGWLSDGRVPFFDCEIKKLLSELGADNVVPNCPAPLNVPGQPNATSESVINELDFTHFSNQETLTPRNAQAMVDMLITPFPVDIEGLDNIQDYDSDKQKEVVNRVTEQVQVSVPRSALNHIASMRTDGEDAPSPMAIMATQATSRVSDPNWFAELNKSSSEALLRELIHIQAFNLWMQYQLYRQNELLLAVSATSSAGTIRQNAALNNIELP